MKLFHAFLLAAACHLTYVAVTVVHYEQQTPARRMHVTTDWQPTLPTSLRSSQNGNPPLDTMETKTRPVIQQDPDDLPPYPPRISPYLLHNRTRYWRFDDVAPTVNNAKTHYLQSIPSQHRIGGPAVPTNLLPLYLYEMNPCIAVLPSKYREEWKQTHTAIDIPVYVVAYRVTHHNNCYKDGVQSFYGAAINETDASQPAINTDYLGLSLLRSDMTVLADVTVDLGARDAGESKAKLAHIFPKYNDFRIFNLREQLYLSTVNRIAPIYLSFDDLMDTANPAPPPHDNVMKIPPTFPNSNNAEAAFRVWVRNYAACPVYGYANGSRKQRRKSKNSTSKNLLYFVDATNATKVLHFPRHNPNDVRHVELDVECGKQAITKYDDSNKKTNNHVVDASFHTIDEYLYPPNNRSSMMFMADRGSACCTQMTDPTTSREVLIAVVHPKTVFPGKNLPDGVAPNIYLSRFIAFEPHAPYTIVARSGMFCFGYPVEGEEGAQHDNPLRNVKMQPLRIGNETFDCPRIHFVMGMVDKVVEEDVEQDSTNESLRQSDKVLISYGVSDCKSRIVEIDKSEIARLLWNPDGNGHDTSAVSMV